MRDTLFGDMPLEGWPPDDVDDAEPWKSFVEARRALGRGNEAEAIAIWKRIVRAREQESRHYLQAWHYLREHGEAPPESRAKHLYGVVLEVPINGGLDLLAAYEDATARYYNHSGAAVIWERPDDRMDARIGALLDAGREVVARIGVWEDPRPAAPAPGHIRINFLTPSGLHFGEGPFDALASDPMGGPVVAAGTDLVQALVELTEEPRG